MASLLAAAQFPFPPRAGSTVRDSSVIRRRTPKSAGGGPARRRRTADLRGDHPPRGAGHSSRGSRSDSVRGLLAPACPVPPVQCVSAHGLRGAKAGQPCALMNGAPVDSRLWRGNATNTPCVVVGPDRGGRPSANFEASPTRSQNLQKSTLTQQAGNRHCRANEFSELRAACNCPGRECLPRRNRGVRTASVQQLTSDPVLAWLLESRVHRPCPWTSGAFIGRRAARR